MASEDRQGSDLSEGEILDSHDSNSGEATGEEREEDVDAQPAPAKRQKTSGGGTVNDVLETSIAMNFGSWKSPLSKRQLKKQRKKKKEFKREKYSKLRKLISKHAEFTDQQISIIQSLIQLKKGGPITGSTLPKLKTSQFKDIVSYLVHSLTQDDSDTTECGRIVVVWLSMVSEKYYHQSPDHFPLLKKLNPAVHFKVEHPGSNRFAKLGLEAFMMRSSQGEGNETSPTLPNVSSDSPPPPRTSYLLSKHQLKENGFPVMESPIGLQGQDCSGYLQILPWPSVDVEDSLSDGVDPDTELPIFAIDCEMVETRVGSELARISIVNESLECIYDTYVKPEFPITDYRTMFSGIAEETLKDVSTSLKDVQEKLKSLLPPRCIIAGHSLENDFHAMKLVHPYVIDTSCVFTPNAPSPFFKPKLKKLSQELLSSEIQSGSGGHSSIEDATACMKLVLLKLSEGSGLTVSLNQLCVSLLTELETFKFTTGIVDKAGVARLFGRNSTHCRESDADTETVKQAIEIIPKCDLTFVQLHDMENFVKSCDKNDEVKQLQVTSGLDSDVQKLIEGCPGRSLVFVVCGSSDISQVKRFQQQDFPDMRRWKEATMVARTGQVIAFMVN